MTNDKPNNDNHIKHIRQTTHVSDQGIRFAEFELAGDEQDVSAPDKHSDIASGAGTHESCGTNEEILDCEAAATAGYELGRGLPLRDQGAAIRAESKGARMACGGRGPFCGFQKLLADLRPDGQRPVQVVFLLAGGSQVRAVPGYGLILFVCLFYELIHGVGWSDPAGL